MYIWEKNHPNNKSFKELKISKKTSLFMILRFTKSKVNQYAWIDSCMQLLNKLHLQRKNLQVGNKRGIFTIIIYSCCEKYPFSDS